MAIMKQVRTSEGQVIMSPVVLRITLTPEQCALVSRYTGKNITQLELCREELQYLSTPTGVHEKWIMIR